MFQITRRRLAIWYTTVTAVLLIIFAVGIYGYVYKTLIDRIDDTLKHVIEIIEPSLIVDEVSINDGKYRVNLEASFYQHPNTTNQVEDDHIDLEWFSPNGELLWQTLDESLPIPLSFNSGGKTIRISDDYLLRQITKRVEMGRYILGYLRVSHPLFDVIKPIQQLIIDLSLGIILMIISVAGIGWFLSGIAIKPVIESYQSLKQFTADASHELRNPIATIKTNIQSLLSYPEIDSQTQQKQLKIVERLTERLNNLVNDLLFLARSDSGIIKPNFASIPLDALLLEVVEEQKIIAQQKNINLSLDIINGELLSENLFIIYGDWGEISRLFTNIISNGIIHGFSSDIKEIPTIKVTLELIKKQHKLFYQITIKDNGIGINESILPHLFDRFYRGDFARSRGNSNYNSSTGLGLAIALAIVENHQGKIKVESSINKGSNFIIHLPQFNG
ncbi:MAG: HAMP domain-containing histidine kinase [Cyanobacteria bacterium]|nr:HAMP domain-containing histidine kinase [Cyanobacteria bacterium CG_2015-16_32_12]NCO78329.1 HAMP domain-containing histidine kinase [Cyanobacteria bacterium CG_2015-22_32_23]NCQ04803.1 HAMP domain-containing histidine kinase [Cyanobacteria bacterium CG_2015-09_32_10]NCQ42351.1 HAMP domain-containing histidine kinase [Cyanobacteria bacterium CG_2015-04_32_10]NCS83784.1 HAMP domain-containing histidine kinase [Cyanobacteria bacterium CG_2015-02_32_10]